MAQQITFFQSATGHNGGSFGQVVTSASAFGSNSVKGDVIFVAYAYWKSGGGQAMPSAITDSLGTSYYPLLKSTATDNGLLYVWWGVVPSTGANTVSATVSGAGTVSTEIVAMEFSVSPNMGITGVNSAGNTNPLTSTPFSTPMLQGALNAGTETMLLSFYFDISTDDTPTNSGMTAVVYVKETVEMTVLGAGYVDSVGAVTEGSTLGSGTWSPGVSNYINSTMVMVALTPTGGGPHASTFVL